MMMLCNLEIQDLEPSALKQSRFAKFKVVYVRGNRAHAQMKAMNTLTEFLKISRKMQALSYQYTHRETRAHSFV